MKFWSLTAPKVVVLTTFGAASDENFVKMTTFLFQWWMKHGSCNCLLPAGFCTYRNHKYPTDTWRKNNAIITSKRLRGVVMLSLRRVSVGKNHIIVIHFLNHKYHIISSHYHAPLYQLYHQLKLGVVMVLTLSWNDDKVGDMTTLGSQRVIRLTLHYSLYFGRSY